MSKKKHNVNNSLGAAEKALKKYRVKRSTVPELLNNSNLIRKQGTLTWINKKRKLENSVYKKAMKSLVQRKNTWSQISKRPLKRMFSGEKALSSINTIETINYRKAVSAFKRGTSLETNSKQINLAVNSFQKAVHKIFGDHDKNTKVATILMKNGWVTSEFFYNDILKKNYHKSEEEILKYIENFYSENNYQRFFRILDLIINGFQEFGMNEGYRLLLIKIKNFVIQDFDNYDLFINALFSIAEYVCDYRFNLLSNNDFINKTSIKKARRKYADEYGNLTAIDLLSLFTVLKKWWVKDSNFRVGLKRTKFNRNTVEHGRFDPRRYERTDFIKLIVFIFNVMMAPELKK